MVFLQDPDDLLFAISALLHRLSPLAENRLTSDRGQFRGAGHIKSKIENAVQFDDFYFHLRRGGHVEALHKHRTNQYFARLDIKNFFYSIARNRVARAFNQAGIDRHVHYAKWSTVKNPYSNSGYSVPYGFVQSPLVASLVLKYSALGQALSEISKEITVSLFVDDIAVSCRSMKQTQIAFDRLSRALQQSGFTTNDKKMQCPAEDIEIFNCSLKKNLTKVTAQRIALFEEVERTIESKIAFESYCAKVAAGNVTSE